MFLIFGILKFSKFKEDKLVHPLNILSILSKEIPFKFFKFK